MPDAYEQFYSALHLTTSSREAKHTINEQIRNMKTETVEILECLKSWYRVAEFKEDLHFMVASEQQAERGAVEPDQ